MKAIWNNICIAESQNTVVVEGNNYFPLSSINKIYFVESSYRTICPWKGEAHYYDVVVDGEKNENAAWYYPQPKEDAIHIKDYVAFWKGIQVVN